CGGRRRGTGGDRSGCTARPRGSSGGTHNSSDLLPNLSAPASETPRPLSYCLTAFPVPPGASAVLLLRLPAAVRVLLRLFIRALRRGRGDEARGGALQLVGVARAVGVGLRGEAQARVVHAADRAVGRERARADEDGQQEHRGDRC